MIVAFDSRAEPGGPTHGLLVTLFHVVDVVEMDDGDLFGRGSHPVLRVFSSLKNRTEKTENINIATIKLC